MDEKQMIDDLVRLLDRNMEEGTGHINVFRDGDEPGPMACGIPNLHQGLDTPEE